MRRAAVMIRAISGIGWANPSVYVLSVAGEYARRSETRPLSELPLLTTIQVCFCKRF